LRNSFTNSFYNTFENSVIIQGAIAAAAARVAIVVYDQRVMMWGILFAKTQNLNQIWAW